ncbi:uncharacterized protein LOC135845923 [Planococcus citri]|uniref:uncharacterized protein LOC135845923 n=1 Tax=Planococcus citri TaxID=170843 RepID=UPI0031FA45B9
MGQVRFVCEQCGKVYSTRYGLSRHKNAVHDPEKVHICDSCGKSFPRIDALKRHIIMKHTERPSKPLQKCNFCDKHLKSICALKSHLKTHKPKTLAKKSTKKPGHFECNDCGTVFKYRQNLIRHIQDKHMYPTIYECHGCGLVYKTKQSYTDHIRSVHESNEKMTCDNCSKNFLCRRSLIKHIANCSKLPKVKKLEPSIICVLCEKTFLRHYLLLKHYTEDHNVTLVYENRQFDSMDQFMKWKQEVEFFTIAGYHSSSGVLDTANSRTRKFRCHRSGVYKSQCENSARVRKLKKKGSKKLQGLCPAEIVVKEFKSDGKCEVKFQTTHVGHEIGTQTELTHIYLDKPKRLELASKIADRIALSVIMENENESLIKGNHDNRKRTITSKDLRNIKLHYVPDLGPSKTASESVPTFVEQNKDSIIFFKNKNEDVSITMLKDSINSDYSFETHDFVLVFMNAEQKKKMELLAVDGVVNIESTHIVSSPERYDLHTVTVLNLNQECLPVAFLLTNRTNESVMTCFVECIKSQVGEMKVKTFVSDLQIMYFKSWTNVMPLPQYYLYYMWHVTQEWDRLCKKIPAHKRDEFRSILDTLYKELDENKFRILLEDFVNQTDLDYQKFIASFKVDFLSNAEQWAYCYRMFSEVDSDADLHFKFNVLGGKRVKTVASCLSSIKSNLSVILREEEMKNINGYTPLKLTTLNSRHTSALEQMGDLTMYCLDEPGKWKVISPENIYTVSVQSPQCLSDCLLKCSECNACLHEYKCTCMDHSIMYNMCVHIHAVLMIFKVERAEEVFVETRDSVGSPLTPAIVSDPVTPERIDDIEMAECEHQVSNEDKSVTEHNLSKDEILAEVRQKFLLLEQNIDTLSTNSSCWSSIKNILDTIPVKIQGVKDE